MTKPITYESPKLTRDGGCLVLANDAPFICIDILKEMFVFPAVSEYYIEASTKQWDDRSGRKIWVGCTDYFWYWGFTKAEQEYPLHLGAENAIKTSELRTDQPVRIYFRLTYNE